jgi:hypothetical protein
MSRSRGFPRRRSDASDEPVPLGDVIDGLLADRALAPGRPIATLASAWP